MRDNPYGPPSSAAPRPSVDSFREFIPRPAGVSILVFLHLIGGFLYLGSLLLFSNPQVLERLERVMPIPPALVIAGIAFLGSLALASGVGMLIGAKWGWWLAAFYYVYGIFRNGSMIINVIVVADQLEEAERGVNYYLTKHSIRIVVSLLLVLYFFKPNVLEYFGLTSLNRGTAIGWLVGICVIITGSVLAFVNR